MGHMNYADLPSAFYATEVIGFYVHKAVPIKDNMTCFYQTVFAPK